MTIIQPKFIKYLRKNLVLSKFDSVLIHFSNISGKMFIKYTKRVEFAIENNLRSYNSLSKSTRKGAQSNL